MNDKGYKPYIPIDTSSPAGSWIEEKRYNRTRPTGESRRVLCGNWQEEQALEGDMLELERTNAERTQAERAALTASGGKPRRLRKGEPNFDATQPSLDIIRDKGNGHYTGGLESTPYMIASSADPKARHLATTHRTDYNPVSADVHSQDRPTLGVRQQLLLQQALAAAKVAQEEAERAHAEQQRSVASRTRRAATSTGGDKHLDDLEDDRTTTVYKAQYCDRHGEVLPTIEELRNDYLSDEPITLYTGNPHTGKTMTVHGKTPVDPVGASRFGKHTYFSEPKYAL